METSSHIHTKETTTPNTTNSESNLQNKGLQNRPSTPIEETTQRRVKWQSNHQSGPRLSSNPVHRQEEEKWRGDRCSETLHTWPWKFALGMLSPHCNELWWLIGLDTTELEYYGRLRLLPLLEDRHGPSVLLRPNIEAALWILTSSGKSARGARVGRSALHRRKGRWTTLPWPSSAELVRGSQKP